MWKVREEIKQLRLAELRIEIAMGVSQSDQGLFVDGLEAFSKTRQRSMQRKQSKGMKPYVLTPRTKQYTGDIQDYIASDNIEAADRVFHALENAVLKLGNWPHG